jgi:DNA (cytosine-5)-methyltransferase 1
VLSAPAVWRPPSRDFVTPTIEDAEAPQGFDRGWTAAASDLIGGSTARWRLVGNAVSVPAAKWVGSRILEQRSWKSVSGGIQLRPGQKWPKSAYGAFGRCFVVDDNEWPGQEPLGSLDDYLSDDLPRLSVRAAAGFLGRLNRSTLKSPSRFRNDLKEFTRNK